MRHRGFLFSLLSFCVSLPLYSFDFNSLDNLHNDHYWHTLLHFKNGESEINDPKFFLSTNGKYKPKEELKAIIQALINNDKSINCRFPARINWVLEQLPELKKKVVSHKCTEIEKILDEYGPKSISLIFPTAHINSPASMYGHTFLRIDADKKTPLISQAINYAAQTDETNGLIYAYQGLVGGYEGRYSILPYYDKIKEYNDMERRDIWEYELNLDKKEIKKLIYHQYELRDIYADYFFFTQNCSYNLLWLLQAARDNTHMVNKFKYKAIPIDTIRVIKEEGFIGNVKFRPSKSRKIKEIVNKIDDFNIARDFLENGFKKEILQNESAVQKSYILDLSSEMLRLKRAKADIGRKEYVSSLMKVLKQRSKIDVKSDYKINEPENPLTGHKTSRLTIGGDKDALYLSLKPSFHDIYDIDFGFKEGAYINFFDLVLKKNWSEEVKLQRFDFVNISSIASIDILFKPLSWEVSFGFNRSYKDELEFKLKGGAGYSYKNRGFLYYAFLNPAFYLGKKSNLSISPKIGFIKNFSKLKLGASAFREIYTDGTKVTFANIFSTYSISKDISLNIKYDIVDNKRKTGVSLFYYF